MAPRGVQGESQSPHLGRLPWSCPGALTSPILPLNCTFPSPKSLRRSHPGLPLLSPQNVAGPLLPRGLHTDCHFSQAHLSAGHSSATPSWPSRLCTNVPTTQPLPNSRPLRSGHSFSYSVFNILYNWFIYYVYHSESASLRPGCGF